MQPTPTPFVDLPAALVEEVLGQAASAGDLLLRTFREVRADKDRLRGTLERARIIRHESDFPAVPIPTTCAADGSYAIERLLTADLAAAAAIAVEGLTPPSETRYWPQPQHTTFVIAEPHHAETATVLRALMLGHELELAVHAPHDLVMLDMTLTLPVIYFNQALNKAHEVNDLECAKRFVVCATKFLSAYRTILLNTRSDHNFIGLPKYSTRRELGTRLGWSAQHDDRGLLTLLLKPGEIVGPESLEQPEPPDSWHINTGNLPDSVRVEARSIADTILGAMKQICTFYYKPHAWLPALRVEVAEHVARNEHRMATILRGLKEQSATPSMLEPYPVYMADRMVKALARAVPAFRQVTTQSISERYEGDIGEVFFAMHGYRSESGA